jgi:hypothetical protein
MEFIKSTALAWKGRSIYSLNPIFCRTSSQKPYKFHTGNLNTILYYINVRKHKTGATKNCGMTAVMVV